MTTWLPAGTPKAMFLVWGDDLTATLTDPTLREELRATGALRLQVNLDDEHVAVIERVLVALAADDLVRHGTSRLLNV